MKPEPEKKLSILVYSDGTDSSIDAVRSGIRLAGATGGTLDILHATDVLLEAELEENAPHVVEPIPRASWPELPEGLRHLALDVLSWLAAEKLCKIPDEIQIRHQGASLRRILVDNCEVSIRLWLSYADPTEALTSIVKENKVDLAIIRGEETSLLKRILGRNLAESMALNLSTNILIIRGAIYPDTPFVIASDGSESSKRTFGIMRKITPALKSKVDVLAKKGADTSDLQEWLTAQKLKGDVIELAQVDEGETSPLNEIVEKLPQNRVLVLGASMRSFFLRAFTGSLPLALVRAAPFSVLISKELPDKADQELKK
mgnify:CR=1 FL=1